MDNDLLGAKEVADILKIARNTVYELIKRGDLISSRVGKQVRVDRHEVESYLMRTQNADSHTVKNRLNQQDSSHLNEMKWKDPSFVNQLQSGGFSKSTVSQPYISTFEDSHLGNELIICGQDISLEILSNHLSTLMENLQIYRSYLGSYNGIYSLYQGRVNVATAHLWDGDTDEYNVSYIRKMMPGIPALVIRIGNRYQGFYVQENNPKEITGWEDLKRKDISIVNREKGSGTRVLLDEKLRLMGMIGEYIEGYSRECKSHLSAASTVARGGADIALGSEMGGKNIIGVQFIPLQIESYDLVIRLSDAEKQPFKSILEIIASDAFKMDLISIGGYDTRETGKIIWGDMR